MSTMTSPVMDTPAPREALTSAPASDATTDIPTPIKKEPGTMAVNGDIVATETSATPLIPPASTTIPALTTPAPNSNGTAVDTLDKKSQSSKKQDKNKTTKRLELEKLMREFQSKLGPNWEKYHEALLYFLIGKLSRPELVSIILPLLRNDNLVHYHNKLLLTQLANSTKEFAPQDYVAGADDFAFFWNKKAAKLTKVKLLQYEKFKQNIMGLPIKERLRIKSITKDSGKQGKLNQGITLTRHSLLPKIPMIQDKEQQQLHVNSLVQWQQDVVNGINTPICTDTYELPDYETLSKRVLMTMREYGLTGGVLASVLEVLLLGLELYLKSIMEKAIDTAKYRENKYSNNDYLPSTLILDEDVLSSPAKRRRVEEPIRQLTKDTTLGIEDIYETLEMFPHLIEPCGPKYRISGVMLENDDASANTLDYQLPPKLDAALLLDKDIEKENDKDKPPAPPKPDAHIGNTDDLKWMLHDLITTM